MFEPDLNGMIEAEESRRRTTGTHKGRYNADYRK